jgi:hypothetical protein
MKTLILLRIKKPRRGRNTRMRDECVRWMLDEVEAVAE